MRTRRSPKNQDKLFKQLFRPGGAAPKAIPRATCWDCTNYPKGGRARGNCTLFGSMVSGRSERECFKAKVRIGMNQPTKEQIEKFIKDVKQMALFYAIKNHEEPPNPDLMVVMKWLEELGDD